MSVCELFDSPDVEMYFYGELDPVDRARVERHLRGCDGCRQRLEDLDAIRHALASRPVVDAPSAGDWSGFMARLDRAVAEPSNLRTFEPSNPRTSESQNHRTSGRQNLRTLIGLAAVLALVTIGVLAAMRFRATQPPVVAVNYGPPAVVSALPVEKTAARGDRALREGSVDHLERSKLVVLGLAAIDPHARAQDWQYERALAGTLLTDTRLYRQAAIQDGAADVERVMRDLETVLLEASMSDTKDQAALERVQRLIAKRDLVVKMQVMAAAGPAGN
jgi:anti-sigma factor RsiW